MRERNASRCALSHQEENAHFQNCETEKENARQFYPPHNRDVLAESHKLITVSTKQYPTSLLEKAILHAQRKS